MRNTYGLAIVALAVAAGCTSNIDAYAANAEEGEAVACVCYTELGHASAQACTDALEYEVPQSEVDCVKEEANEHPELNEYFGCLVDAQNVLIDCLEGANDNCASVGSTFTACLGAYATAAGSCADTADVSTAVLAEVGDCSPD